MLDSLGRDDPLPPAGRRGAGHRAVPIMIDSSKWSVIEAGLKCVQGKSIVNSISLKEGEAEFVKHAKLARRLRRAVIVMAFDEKGQADSLKRKTEICQRCYRILTGAGGLPARTSSSTRTSSRSPPASRSTTRTAAITSRRVAWIHRHLPHARTSGGVSNFSFSFRGNEPVREAMHTAFLYHAAKAGMTMGIVNAGQLGVYADIPKDLLERVEDVIFNRRPDATERLVEFAESFKGQKKDAAEDEAWRKAPVRDRIVHAAREGHHAAHHRGHGGGAAPVRAPAAGDRGPAHGRHERRGRPLRLREDVPAAGREIRARR
jgi:5-methyltetrahydrofolate--homocysteine methyltransferase